MPQSTEYREQLADAVRVAIGDLGIPQASYKTGVSYETLRKMVRFGHVPSEVILAKVAQGLGADLYKLRAAAGYEQPADVVERVCIALRGDSTIPEEGKRQVLDFVRELQERGGKGT